MEDNIKVDVQEVELGALTRFVWFGVWTGGGRLSMRQGAFRFHKMRGFLGGLAEVLLAFQEELCCMQ